MKRARSFSPESPSSSSSSPVRTASAEYPASPPTSPFCVLSPRRKDESQSSPLSLPPSPPPSAPPAPPRARRRRIKHPLEKQLADQWKCIEPSWVSDDDDDDDDDDANEDEDEDDGTVDVGRVNDSLNESDRRRHLRPFLVRARPVPGIVDNAIYAVVPGTDGKQMVRGGTNERNTFERDRRIRFIGGEEFPDEHYYMIDRDRTGVSSATGLLRFAFTPFESKRMMIATRCANTRNPTSRYYGKSVDEVLAMWDEARDTGTAKHAAIDDFLQARPFRWHQVGSGRRIKYPPSGLYAFLRRHPTFEVVRTEWSIFCDARLLAGQLDALFYCTRQKIYVIVDWKNVETFTVGNRDRGIHALTRDMPDCHLSHYTLQLNIYRHIIEQYYGIKIGAMFVANFPPSRAHECHEYIIWPLDVTPLLDLMPITEEGRQRLVEQKKKIEAGWTYNSDEDF